MDNLETLHTQLNRAAVDDGMIARGVRLTPNGIRKLTRLLGVSEDELAVMLGQLSDQMKTLNESVDGDRYGYESDISGSVMLRDSQTGAQRYLEGSQGASFLYEIERSYPHIQEVIASYFSDDHLTESDVSFADDIKKGAMGSYNFPYRKYLACALYSLSDNKPNIEIKSLTDQDGEEVIMDDKMRADVTKTAIEWIDRV